MRERWKGGDGGGDEAIEENKGKTRREAEVHIYSHKQETKTYLHAYKHASAAGGHETWTFGTRTRKEEDGAKGRGGSMQRKSNTYAHMPGRWSPSIPFLMSSEAPENPSRMSWKSKACVGEGRQTSRRREGSRRRRGKVSLALGLREGALRLCDGAIVVDKQTLCLCIHKW